MSELFAAATTAVVLPLTTLMALLALYWLIVFLGFLDIDLFQLDFDSEAVMPSLLGLGEAPLMIVLSILVAVSWHVGVLATHFLPLSTPLLALVIYVPGGMLSLFITRLVARPLGELVHNLNKSHAAVEEVEAQMATLLSDNDGTRISQASIQSNGAPVLVNVKARKGCFINKNSEVLIIEADETSKFYFVEEIDSLEQ